MQITEHFNRDEFCCHDRLKTPYPCKWIDERLFPLCQILEKIRDKVGPLKINSGYRTPEYNDKVPGAVKKSAHTLGIAADFKCLDPTINGRKLYAIVEEMIRKKEIPNGGLGSYINRVHYDTGKARRWKK